jgi:gas vesicle protein
MGNNKESGMFYRGLFIGTIIGGVAGAITALLYAPKPGVELRKDLAEKSSEIYEKASDMFANVETKVGTVVSNTINEGKNKAQVVVDAAKRQAEGLLENADSIIQGAKSKAYAAKDIIADKFVDIKDAAKAGAEAFRNELNSK